MPVRVTVLENWEEIPLEVPPETPVGDLKAQALRASRVRHPADHYLVKYQGAELGDESATLASAGVVANGALIVLARRRLPAR